MHHGLTRLEDLLQAEDSDLADIPQIGEQAATIMEAARAEAARRTLPVGETPSLVEVCRRGTSLLPVGFEPMKALYREWLAVIKIYARSYLRHFKETSAWRTKKFWPGRRNWALPPREVASSSLDKITAEYLEEQIRKEHPELGPRRRRRRPPAAAGRTHRRFIRAA